MSAYFLRIIEKENLGLPVSGSSIPEKRYSWEIYWDDKQEMLLGYSRKDTDSPEEAYEQAVDSCVGIDYPRELKRCSKKKEEASLGGTGFVEELWVDYYGSIKKEILKFNGKVCRLVSEKDFALIKSLSAHPVNMRYECLSGQIYFTRSAESDASSLSPLKAHGEPSDSTGLSVFDENKTSTERSYKNTLIYDIPILLASLVLPSLTFILSTHYDKRNHVTHVNWILDTIVSLACLYITGNWILSNKRDQIKNKKLSSLKLDKTYARLIQILKDSPIEDRESASASTVGIHGSRYTLGHQKVNATSEPEVELDSMNVYGKRYP